MKKVFRRILTLLALALLVRGCVIEPIRISDDAMAPKLWEGDVILISKLSYGLRIPGPGAVLISWSDVKKGDLVFVSGGGEPPVTVVRRVSAVPGERVKLSETEPERTLHAGEYVVTMDQRPKKIGIRDMKTLVVRQSIAGKRGAFGFHRIQR